MSRLFVFDLCDKRGWLHPNYILPLMWWEELTDWITYYEMKESGETGATELAPKIDVAATLELIDRLKKSRESTAI